MDIETFDIIIGVLGTVLVLALTYFGREVGKYRPLIVQLLRIAEQLAEQTPSLADDKLVDRLLELMVADGQIELVETDHDEYQYQLDGSEGNYPRDFNFPPHDNDCKLCNPSTHSGDIHDFGQIETGEIVPESADYLPGTIPHDDKADEEPVVE